jgi:hypothetical protein
MLLIVPDPHAVIDWPPAHGGPGGRGGHGG